MSVYCRQGWLEYKKKIIQLKDIKPGVDRTVYSDIQVNWKYVYRRTSRTKARGGGEEEMPIKCHGWKGERIWVNCVAWEGREFQHWL